MANVGYATLQVIPSMKGAASALQSEATGMGGGAATAFGGSFGKLALAAAGPALVAGVGAALYSIGSQFDTAFDKIRVTTGATGKTLDGLKDSFKNVIQDVPTDFASAAQAIGDVNARLGLTGEPLERVTKQLLELSRLTGTDLKSNIASTTRLFGDWSVSTEAQAGTLDKLFRASQVSGIEVGRLSDYMVQFGAPLRQLGFDFDTSAAMFARFEKEGVNITTLMPGLKMALKNFAAAGREPVQALQETFDLIKAAPSNLEAAGIASKIFGARAGPDMAAAIREGRFELDAMKDAIVNGKDTIIAAGKDTQDFSEKWQMFKNKVLVGLEPLATAVFNAVGDAMDRLGPIAESFFTWISNSKPALIALGAVLGGLLLAALYAATTAMIGFAVSMIAAVAIPALIVAALVALGVGLVYAYNNFEAFRNIVDGVVSWMVDVAWPAIQQFAQFISDEFSHLADWVRAHWEQIQLAIQNVITVITAIVTGFVAYVEFMWNTFGEALVNQAQAIWAFIQSVIQAAFQIIQGIFTFFLGVLTLDWSTAWEGIQQIFQGFWDWAIALVQLAWSTIQSYLIAGLAALSVAWAAAWIAIQAIAQAVWDGILALISAAWSWIYSLLSSGLSALSALWDAIWNAIRSVAESTWSAIVAVVAGAWAALSSPLAAMAGAVAAVGAAMQAASAIAAWAWGAISGAIVGGWDAASGALGALLDGLSTIVGALQAIIDKASAVKNAIASVLGSSPDFQTALNQLGGAGRGAQAPSYSWGGGRAVGGTVMAGTSYLVGEDGPEILSMGGRSGYITPNNQLGGGGGDWSALLAATLETNRRLAAIEANQNRGKSSGPSRSIVGGRR